MIFPVSSKASALPYPVIDFIMVSVFFLLVSGFSVFVYAKIHLFPQITHVVGNFATQHVNINPLYAMCGIILHVVGAEFAHRVNSGNMLRVDPHWLEE